MLTFYSDSQGSNPAEVYIFSLTVVEKTENKQKEAGVVGPFKKD